MVPVTGYEKVRSAREIGERASIVGAIIAMFKLRGQDDRSYAPLLRVAMGSLKPSDNELFDRGHWSESVKQDLLWQMECLHVLLWAIGRVPALSPIDQMVEPQAIIEEVNSMARDPSTWLDSLVRRSDAELDSLYELMNFWIDRARSGPKAGRRTLPPFVKSSVEDAVARGVLAANEVMQGDVVARGQPFYTLDFDQQADIGSIALERSRAICWIVRDFEDWWEPALY